VNKPVEMSLERYLRLFPAEMMYYSEAKYDGERVVVEVADGVTIANMHTAIYTSRDLPPSFIEEVERALPQGLYDCEFYSVEGDLYDFLSARARMDGRLALAVWYRFNSRELDYKAVREELERTVNPTENVKLVERDVCLTEDEILESKRKWVDRGFEGVVVKPAYGNYHSKWLKLRQYHTADVVILGIKKTGSWIKHGIPATFLVGCWDGEGFQRLGDVSSGLKAYEKQAIGEVLREAATGEDGEYVYVKPEVVLEIEYHKRMAGGLRFPRIKRLRFDKPPEDTHL